MPTKFVEMTHPSGKSTARVPSTDVERRKKRGWKVKGEDGEQQTASGDGTPPATPPGDGPPPEGDPKARKPGR